MSASARGAHRLRGHIQATVRCSRAKRADIRPPSPPRRCGSARRSRRRRVFPRARCRGQRQRHLLDRPVVAVRAHRVEGQDASVHRRDRSGPDLAADSRTRSPTGRSTRSPRCSAPARSPTERSTGLQPTSRGARRPSRSPGRRTGSTSPGGCCRPRGSQASTPRCAARHRSSTSSAEGSTTVASTSTASSSS